MSNSIQKELEEIEQRNKMAQVSKGTRRGSSIFAMPEGINGIGPYGRPAYLSNPGDDLLVDFPDKSNDFQSQYSQQSGYMSYNSQTSDGIVISGSMRNDNYGGYGHNPNKPRLSEAARVEELINSQDLPGGINHRPLVGGFAAAAYEAAKAHHYSIKKEGPRSREAPMDQRPQSY